MDTIAATARLSFRDGIAFLTLNRPHAGNAINQAMADELGLAVAEIARRDNCHVVVLDSVGRAFCVGGDVRAMAAAADRGAMLTDLAGALHEALNALRALPVTIVAAVQGAVAGAGLGLVLSADLVVCAESATFRTGYAGIGLSPDGGVSALLPAVVGARRAAQLALTGRVLAASDALEWGLVSEVCADDDLVVRTQELALPPRLIEASQRSYSMRQRRLPGWAGRPKRAPSSTDSSIVAGSGLGSNCAQPSAKSPDRSERTT